jgi:DNA modification methylase
MSIKQRKRSLFSNEITEENKNLVKNILGTTLESVWNLNKPKYLCELVNDNFNRDRDPNKKFSELNPEVIRKCMLIWSDENDVVLDPFLNRGTTPIISAYCGRKGYANDVVPTYVNQVLKQKDELLSKKYSWAENIHINNGDARDIINIVRKNFKMENVDYIITSPPFWNVEPYESVEGQMADIETYDEFLKDYDFIISQLYEILNGDSFVTYIVNDFRKEKEFYDFSGDTIALFKKNGFKLHDKVINYLRSPFNMRMGKAYDYERATIKAHEFILTFRKGDIRRKK